MKNDSKPASPKDERIGQILKKRRQSLRLSLTDVELATKIRGKFLIALENNDYESLRHDVYSKGFVQSYADFLGLNGRVLAKQYLAERGNIDNEPLAQTTTKRSLVVTPKLVIAIASLLVLVAVLAYLGWQVSTLAAAPKLSVTNPSSDQVIQGSLVQIDGKATLGADVFINEAPVLTDSHGGFSEKVALQDGVNTIHIVAKNRLGKSSAVTRSILAKIPKPLIAGEATPATIQGVRVDVGIKKSAVPITVSVDGQEVFNGTMLAGTTQTFSGNQSVVITTGNAGETALVVTNAVAAGKKLDPVGAEGAVKRNLEFDASTVIP